MKTFIKSAFRTSMGTMSFYLGLWFDECSDRFYGFDESSVKCSMNTLDDFVIVFGDDILIDIDKQEHEEHQNLAFEALRKNKLCAKFSKCDFSRKDVLLKHYFQRLYIRRIFKSGCSYGMVSSKDCC